MADEVLRVGSNFDPSGFIRGLDLGEAALADFQQMVQAVAKSLPGLDLQGQMKVAAAGIQQTTARTRELEGALKAAGAAQLSIIAGMSQAGRAGAAGTAGNVAWARGLENLKAANAGVTESFRASNRASNMMRSGLVALAAQSIGTSSAIGQLAQSALFFSGGVGAVIKVASVVLAAAFAYDKLTAAAKKAAEEQKKAIDSFKSTVTAGDTEGINAELAIATKRANDLKQIIASTRVGITLDPGGKARITSQKEYNALLKEQSELTVLVGRGNDAVIVADQARTTASRDLVAALQLEAAVLQGTDTAVRRLALAKTKDLLPADKAQALAAFDLIEALKAEKAANEAAQKSAQEHAQFLKQQEQAYHDLAAAALGLSLGLGKDIAQGYKDAEDAARTFAEATQDAIDQLPDATEDATDHAARLAETMDEVERSTISASLAAAGLGENLSHVITNTLGAAQAFGSIQQAKTDFDNATDAAGRLEAKMREIQAIGDLFTGVLGFAGGVFGAIAGAGQPSESDRLMAENNRRLAELSVSLDAMSGAGKLSVTGGVLDDVRDLIRTGMVHTVSDLEEHLARSGLTVAEWGAQLEAMTGLDILDEQGRIIAGSLAAADVALRRLEEAATHFSDTLDVINQRADLQDSFARAGGGTGRSDLERDRAALLAGLNLGKAEIPIAALDLDTEAGRAAYLEWLEQLYALAAAGRLSAEQLGLFGSVDELLAPIGQSADDIAAANEHAAQAARDLAEAQRQATIAHGDEVRRLMDLRSRITGTDDPSSLFQNALAGLGEGAQGFLQHFIGALGTTDFNTDALRDQLQRQVLEWLDNVRLGLMTAEDLGLTEDQFNQFLEDAARFLEGFNEQVQDATQSLTNLPRGYNSALAQLEHMVQGMGPGSRQIPLGPPVMMPPPPRFGISPTRLTARGGDGASIPSISQHIASVVIQVHQLPGENAEDLTRRIVRVLELRNLARSGDPTRP